MPITRGLLPLGVLLIGTSAGWAFDEAPQLSGREPACSSLCRSWLSLGSGRDSAPTAAPGVQVVAPPTVVVAPAPRAGATPPTAKPVRAGTVAMRHGMPPLPPRRDDAKHRPVVVVVAAGSPRLPVPDIAASVPMRAALVLPPPPVSPATVDVAALRAAASPTDDPSRSPAAVTSDATRPATAERADPVSPPPANPVAPGQQTAPPASATPFSVKAGFYAVLTAAAVWGFRSPRPASPPADAGPSIALRARVRRGSRRRPSPVGPLATARD